jgi:hypothetical protein
MSRGRRILFFVAISGVLCVVYVWFFGVATMFALEARYVGWKMPAVRRTPAELEDSSIAQGPGQKLSYFGYEFEVPWDVEEAKTRQAGRMQLVVFRSGNALLVSRMAPKEFVNSFLSSAKCDPAAVRALYGENVLQSDYSLTRLILEATPDQVGLLASRRNAVAGAMLLVIKGIMIPQAGESGIYRIRAGNFQGFQFGDPTRRPKSLDVEIFEEGGGLGFIFTQRENGPVPPITQAEINRVVQSLQKSSN